MTMAGALMVIDTETLPRSMPANSSRHVVEGIDGDAQPADFAERARIVAVEAHECGQIEGGAEAGLALLRAGI